MVPAGAFEGFETEDCACSAVSFFLQLVKQARLPPRMRDSVKVEIFFIWLSRFPAPNALMATLFEGKVKGKDEWIFEF